MKGLLEIGFECAGHWHLNGEQLGFKLDRFQSRKNILYAFVVDGTVKYVGKTVQSLHGRMCGYKNPGRTQSTNIKNNEHIRLLLRAGDDVEIHALPDSGLHRYGDFHLNLSAGLEDSIIKVLNPEWNGGKRSIEPEVTIPDVPVLSEPTSSFVLILQPTYYLSGFFNVSVTNANDFGVDGQKIEIFCGAAEQPIIGTINRRANKNSTPRIIGGAVLREWFQLNCTAGQEIKISVISPTAIRLETNI